MSKNRQTRTQRTSKVRSYAITHPPGLVSLPTQPGWDYLVHARDGLFTALAEQRAWTVPAHRALSVPDGTRIRIETTRPVSIRCLYLAADLGSIGPELRVVTLAPLTRELVNRAVAAAPLTLDNEADQASITLLASCLADEADEPLHLPLPTDDEAAKVARWIMAEPAADLGSRIDEVGAGRRTVERRFRVETGMSLGQWRRRARVLAAVALLADGQDVTRVSVAVGYATPSSFVAAFKSETGLPPRRFMDRSRS